MQTIYLVLYVLTLVGCPPPCPCDMAKHRECIPTETTPCHR